MPWTFYSATGQQLKKSEIADNAVTTAKIADDAVTLAKMASGTDGQIITYDASGNPVAVGPGTDGQVLTSTGAGSPPAFETVSAGISGHGTVVIKSSDQTVNNSTTLVNDDTLVWALAANKNYRLWAHAFIDTHISSDFKWTFTGPTDCEVHLTVNRNYAAGASYDWHGLNVLGTNVSMGTPTDTASNWYWFGTIMNSSNAGNLQLQWAQNVAQSFDTKMHNGSWGIVELLN